MPRKPSPPEIYKFGGASLADAAAFLHAADIARRCPSPLVVVCSAPTGVTDLLLEVAERARHGEAAKVKSAVQGVREKFLAAAGALRARAEIEREIEVSLGELETLAGGLVVLRELTARTSDLVVARGERLSARLFAAVLKAAGRPAEYVDALEVVVTAGPFGGAAPDLEGTDRQAR